MTKYSIVVLYPNFLLETIQSVPLNDTGSVLNIECQVNFAPRCINLPFPSILKLKMTSTVFTETSKRRAVSDRA